MERQDFRKRVLQPVIIIFIIALLSWIVYNVAWRLENRTLHQALAAVSGTLLFVSVTFGTLFIYPAVYFRGASLRERVLASLVNPFLWATKENIRLSISYSLAECLYYYFNPLNIWLFLGIIAQMGLAEMLCRWMQARRGEDIRIFGAAPLAAFVGGLFLVICLFAWGQGENAYVIFLSGYRKLFGAGI